MLSTETRRLYTECLEAPLGHRFDRGIATTFTLSLETLLVLPFSLAGLGTAEPELLLADPVALLESLQETGDRLAVFCHDGYIAVPPREQALYGRLDWCVVPVRAPRRQGLFHPKLWLLRFVDEAGGAILRAVVLSRNLTFYWELGHGAVPRGRAHRPPGAGQLVGLADLVGHLPKLATRPLDDRRADMVARLAEEVARTRFETPEPFRWGPVFHAIGVPRGKGVATFPPDGRGHGDPGDSRVPVPVPRHGQARGEALGVGEPILVSRGESLAQVPAAALAGWRVRTLSDAAVTGETADEDEEAGSLAAAGTPPTGLHAKIVGIEDHKRRVSWWIRVGEPHGGGLERAERGADGGARGWRARTWGSTRSWRRGSGRSSRTGSRRSPTPRSSSGRRPRPRWTRPGMRSSPRAFGWRALPRAGTGRFGSTAGPRSRTEIGDEVEVTAWPVTLLQAQHERRIADGAGEPVVWSPLSAASLTSLVAFEARVGTGKTAARARFALQLPIVGLPEDPRRPHRAEHRGDAVGVPALPEAVARARGGNAAGEPGGAVYAYRQWGRLRRRRAVAHRTDLDVHASAWAAQARQDLPGLRGLLHALRHRLPRPAAGSADLPRR